MTLPGAFAWLVAVLATLPLLLVVWNLHLLRRLTPGRSASRLSILIPARNEAASIGAAIDSVLASRGAELELLVLDDHSTDDTARVVARRARQDPRVRLLGATRHEPALWGKPQACAQLAVAARGDYLVFMDADVRLAPDAVARLAHAMDTSPAAMLSGVPRQRTVTLAEKLVVPLIQFVLLGFLPLAAMRRSQLPGFGVACGQLLVVRTDAYRTAGGHLGVADRIHDGMALARAFRNARFGTDLADFSDLATCRMYRSTRGVIDGFAKNAHEGLGSPRGLVPWTALLIGGQCAWVAMLPAAIAGTASVTAVGIAAAASMTTRVLLDLRFGQSLLAASLHPAGVLGLVSIQWYALARRLIGRPVAWKDRVVSPSAGPRRGKDARAPTSSGIAR